MNPYVSFGLAMCLVTAVSLFFTAYLAVHFNRRGKADLLAALTPLNELIEGEIDIEEARVLGRYKGQIAEGRAANSTDGPGKSFLTSVVDGAGGSSWSYTLQNPKDPAAAPIAKLEGVDAANAAGFGAEIERLTAPLIAKPGWGRSSYDPAPGRVLLSRPMMTRRDIPDVERFQAQLDALIELADRNRAFQQRNGIPE